ncbi:unnamed protein product, partial [Scytosiphon promiscuus]
LPSLLPALAPIAPFLDVPQHIYTNGDICLSLLSSRDWKPNLTVM